MPIKKKIKYPFDVSKIKTFSDIPMLIQYDQGHLWSETLHFPSVDRWYLGLDHGSNEKKYDIDICPDFQRGHVWTNDQRVSFVEYMLRGGKQNNTIIFNQMGDSLHNGKYPYQCIDGLQRITSVHMFMHDELEVFGGLTCSEMVKRYKYKKFPGTTYYLNIQCTNLKTRADILAFYLEFNSAGTVHTEKELERVWKLYEREITK
jgi:hypothetical protein